jgi:hypothetical protein
MLISFGMGKKWKFFLLLYTFVLWDNEDDKGLVMENLNEIYIVSSSLLGRLVLSSYRPQVDCSCTSLQIFAASFPMPNLMTPPKPLVVDEQEHAIIIHVVFEHVGLGELYR